MGRNRGRGVLAKVDAGFRVRGKPSEPVDGRRRPEVDSPSLGLYASLAGHLGGLPLQLFSSGDTRMPRSAVGETIPSSPSPPPLRSRSASSSLPSASGSRSPISVTVGLSAASPVLGQAGPDTVVVGLVACVLLFLTPPRGVTRTAAPRHNRNWSATPQLVILYQHYTLWWGNQRVVANFVTMDDEGRNASGHHGAKTRSSVSTSHGASPEPASTRSAPWASR